MAKTCCYHQCIYVHETIKESIVLRRKVEQMAFELLMNHILRHLGTVNYMDGGIILASCQLRGNGQAYSARTSYH